MEVIVKPLEGVLDGLPGFSGTALLGDGRVLLILDLKEILR
jgi:two-component system chemotaxis sensor kinase CheA